MIGSGVGRRFPVGAQQEKNLLPPEYFRYQARQSRTLCSLILLGSPGLLSPPVLKPLGPVFQPCDTPRVPQKLAGSAAPRSRDSLAAARATMTSLWRLSLSDVIVPIEAAWGADCSGLGGDTFLGTCRGSKGYVLCS